MRLLLLALLLVSAAAWSLPTTTEVRALAAEQARATIAPFCPALNAGHDPVELINHTTPPDGTSCVGAETCRRRDQAKVAIADLEQAVPDLKWETRA